MYVSPADLSALVSFLEEHSHLLRKHEVRRVEEVRGCLDDHERLHRDDIADLFEMRERLQ